MAKAVKGAMGWGEIQEEDRVSVSARALVWSWPQGAEGEARRLEQSSVGGWERMRSATSWRGGGRL